MNAYTVTMDLVETGDMFGSTEDVRTFNASTDAAAWRRAWDLATDADAKRFALTRDGDVVNEWVWR